MALRVDAAGWLTKWGQNLNAAGTAITNGVNRVSVAPGAAAAAAQQLMLQRLTDAINSGKWAARVSAVSLTDWKNAMLNKGAGRIAAGVQAAQQSSTTKTNVATLLANVETAANAANQLPKGGIEQSVQRAATFMRTMQQLSAKG